MIDSTRRWWALAAISVTVLVIGLDLTVLSLALPTIAADLHATTGDRQWITDSYSLVIAALILPAGLLGDRYGRKKVLLAVTFLPRHSGAAARRARGASEKPPREPAGSSGN